MVTRRNGASSVFVQHLFINSKSELNCCVCNELTEPREKKVASVAKRASWATRDKRVSVCAFDGLYFC